MTDKKITVAPVPVGIIRFHPHNVRRGLGDLRELTASIKKLGVMQPIVVERMGQQLRLRAGHRRVAAAKLAGLKHVPAVIHAEPLDEPDWIVHALHENTFRAGLSDAERRDAIQALLRHGCSRSGIAEQLGVSVATISRWLAEPQPEPTTDAGQPTGTPPAKAKKPPLRTRVLQLADQWQTRAEQGLSAAEARQLLEEIRRLTAPPSGGGPATPAERPDVDPVAVERTVAGNPPATLRPAERREAVRALTERGRSARQIADQLRIEPRSVHRLRGGAA